MRHRYWGCHAAQRTRSRDRYYPHGRGRVEHNSTHASTRQTFGCSPPITDHLYTAPESLSLHITTSATTSSPRPGQSSSPIFQSLFEVHLPHHSERVHVHQGHEASTCLATGPAWLLFLALRAFLHKLYTCSTVTITLNQFSQVTFAMIRTPKY